MLPPCLGVHSPSSALREESWPHDGVVGKAAAHLSSDLQSSLEREPHVLSTNNELGHRDPLQAFLHSACPLLLVSSLSAALTKGSGCSQLLMAELMATWGQFLLASSQERNEVNPLQLKEINVSLPAKIIRERESQGFWAGLALGRVGLPDFPSCPLQSPRETKVHSGAANVS